MRRSSTDERLAAQQLPFGAPSLPSRTWHLGVVLLLLTAIGVYIFHLHQARLRWENTANQLVIGQEVLREDRDNFLQNVKDLEATLINIEPRFEQRGLRLAALNEERRGLQSKILRLTKSLAAAKGQQGQGNGLDHNELDELKRRIDNKDGEISRLSANLTHLQAVATELAETAAKSGEGAVAREQLTYEAGLQRRAFQDEAIRVKEKLAEMRQIARHWQLVHIHDSGEVKPDQNLLGPEYWQTMENWLEQTFQRSMHVPDLSQFGWSYEGARILSATEDQPPMAMLLYANHADVLSLTIARTSSGTQSSAAEVDADLNVVNWRDEHGAFMLIGPDKLSLQVMAAAVQDPDQDVTSGSTVPTSRFFRPARRADDKARPR